MHWWQSEEKIQWAILLLESFHRWLNRDLIQRAGDQAAQAARLFMAPFVVVSHGTEPDPILNYGNRTALTLWELSWEEWRVTPSRLTAEPVDQSERATMLGRALSEGVIQDYRGIRISRSGRRFLVENAIVWTVVTAAGVRVGQAATFERWKYLDGEDGRPAQRPSASIP